MKKKANNRYFAYVVRKEDDEFLGYVNFHFNSKDNKYECGVVIEARHRGKGYGKEALMLLCDTAFNKYNIDALYDSFEEGRSSVKIFEQLGFKKVKEITATRFKKDIIVIEVLLKKEDFIGLNNN